MAIKRLWNKIWNISKWENTFLPIKTIPSNVMNKDIAKVIVRNEFKENTLDYNSSKHLILNYLNKVIQDHHHKKIAVLFINIDYLKTMDEILTEDIGDRVSKQLVERLHHYLEYSPLLYRLGKEEIVIVLENLPEIEKVMNLSHDLLRHISESNAAISNLALLNANTGISIYPDDALEAKTLLQNSNSAMFQARKQGRFRFTIFNSQYHNQLMEKITVENELHKAIENNELYLDFQPQVNINQNEVVNVEALVRWYSERLGFLPPNKFIPIAEETGLIIPIGNWVLKEACKTNKAWQMQGYKPITISVNISLKQLLHKDFISVLSNTLKETSLDPQYLELEITESIGMKVMDDAILKMLQIQSMGVKIAIDDFGKEYSSLSYLKHLPINKIKIDRSFMSNIPKINKDTFILDSILYLVQKLDLHVVAEGVETHHQLNYLKQLDHPIIVQGFLISKPLSKEDFERFISEQNKRMKDIYILS